MTDLQVQNQIAAARLHQMDVHTAKQYITDTDARTPSAGIEALNALEDEARELAATNPLFAEVWALRNANLPVVPLDEAGEPDGPVSTDLATLMRMWTERPDRWPGVPCAEAGVLLLAFTPEGYGVFRGWAKSPHSKGLRQGWAGDDTTYREHYGSMCVLGEPPRPVPQWRSVAFTEDNAEQVAKAVAAASFSSIVRNPWLCWRRPGVDLPVGEISKGLGVFVRAAVPVLGARLVLSGQRLQVLSAPSGARLMDPPDWLVESLHRGKRGRPASLAKDREKAADALLQEVP